MTKVKSTKKTKKTKKVKITKLPPGEALGARDLQTWAGRRAGREAGVPWTGRDKDEWARRKGTPLTKKEKKRLGRLGERWREHNNENN